MMIQKLRCFVAHLDDWFIISGTKFNLQHANLRYRVHTSVFRTLQGVQAVADFIETELSPEEVLDAMGSVILLRNRHSLLAKGFPGVEG